MNDASMNVPAERVDSHAGQALCGNCQTPLIGPFCHVCGQPLRSPVRELFAVARDSLGELFSLDGRFFRSMIPLYFRPGTLTREYFAGRRVSFIKPFRMYLGVSIVMLVLLAGITSDVKLDSKPKASETKDSAVTADAEPKASKARDQTGAKVESEAAPANEASDTGKPEKVETTPTGFSIGPAKDGEPGLNMNFNGTPFDAEKNPLRLSWAPAWFEQWLNGELAVLEEKGHVLEQDPNRLLPSLWQNIPRAMFFLLPVFALFLKLIYIFKRRLYIEHIIVALHSHSFIFLSVILVLGWNALSRALGFGGATYGIVLGLMLAWIPIYLFIMQKQVYRQGWIMTSIKFVLTGTLYLILVTLTTVLALLLAIRFLD